METEIMMIENKLAVLDLERDKGKKTAKLLRGSIRGFPAAKRSPK